MSGRVTVVTRVQEVTAMIRSFRIVSFMALAGLFTPAPASASPATAWTETGRGIEISTGAGTAPGGRCGLVPSTLSGVTFRTFGGSGGTSGFLLAFFERGPVFADALPLMPPLPHFFNNPGFRV